MGQGTVVTATAKSATDARLPSTLRDRVGSGGALRILLAERRASAHSELSRRLKSHGHDVVARVTSAQGAIDYAGLLAPDVVLFAPVLEDAAGLTVAMTVSRQQPGVAAVVFTTHPAAADPASRPNWGSVALLPADVEADELNSELWRAVKRARESVAVIDRTADVASEGEVGMTHRAPVVEAPSVGHAEPIARAEPARTVKAAQPVVESFVGSFIESFADPDPMLEIVSSPRHRESFADVEMFVDLSSFMGVESVVEHDPYVEIEVVADAELTPARMSQAAEQTEEQMIAEMVDALYPTPGDTITLVDPRTDDAGAEMVETVEIGESDEDVVARAVAVLVERVRLTQTMAYRLMEQEAADTALSIADVARNMLNDARA